MIRGLYEGDICGKQLLANFLRVNISKIQAQPNSENKVLLQVMMMAKMNQKMITGYQRIQKGYDEVELGLRQLVS